MLETLHHAFDSVFLIRFAFAFLFYWAWGILAKGILEPIQSHLGKQLYATLFRSTLSLSNRAAQSCSDIDDLVMGYISDASRRINNIVNPSDLNPTDSDKLRKLIVSQYDLGKLLDKL